jgi:hypothetical protein
MSEMCQQLSSLRSKLLHSSITTSLTRVIGVGGMVSPRHKASLTHPRCDASSRAPVAKLFA